MAIDNGIENRRAATASGVEESGGRKIYSRPTLKAYGHIAALTQAGTGLSSEGGGMGMGMSNAPNKRL